MIGQAIQLACAKVGNQQRVDTIEQQAIGAFDTSTVIDQLCHLSFRGDLVDSSVLAIVVSAIRDVDITKTVDLYIVQEYRRIREIAGLGQYRLVPLQVDTHDLIYICDIQLIIEEVDALRVIHAIG